MGPVYESEPAFWSYGKNVSRFWNLNVDWELRGAAATKLSIGETRLPGIAKKIQLFNDALKLVMLNGTEERRRMMAGRLNSAARIRALISNGETQAVLIAAEAIRRLESAAAV
jgi:hypothetical protein